MRRWEAMPYATRTFRVFVSSTFSDLRGERDALQESVFPALSRLCTAAGATFQPIDLRWGVSDEAGLDQQTMTICLTELERCQSTGIKPNFLILLGDRYGWLPLPPTIPAEEYSQILSVVDDADERALLERWYGTEAEGDANAVPKVQRLRPRDPDGQYAEAETWAREETAIRAVLLGSVRKLDFPPAALAKYLASATEQEIIEGALGVADAAQHVFCFSRGIDGLPESLAPPQGDPARAYRNFGPDGALAREADETLAALRERLRAKLGDQYVPYRALWVEGRAGAGPSTAHIGALTADADCDPALRVPGDEAGTLCRDVYDRLAGVIREQLAALGTMTAEELEAAAIADYVRERTHFFTGRVQTLGSIRDYLVASGREPLAIWGWSGSGKSTVMAKVVADVMDDAARSDVNVIAKFIGATSSGDGREMLDDLVNRIADLYGDAASSGGRAYEDLVQQFSDKLVLAEGGKPLWLFLDALDQLSETNNARSLVWLPDNLPENVRIIVSTTPGECLANLRRKVATDHLVELEPMPVDEGALLLQSWLDDAGRTLTDEQREAILSRFAGCPVPLFLRLAFEEARRWTSTQGVPPMAADTPGLIRQMFDRLADPANHGAELVDRVVSLLAASRYGLSEEELLGALAWDDGYWRQFIAEDAYHDLPSVMKGSQRERWRRRIPVAVWARLFYDLQPYLSERLVEGARVLAFYHRQLGEVAYLDRLADRDADESVRERAVAVEALLQRGELAAGDVLAVPLSAAGRERHRVLAEYFQWAADPAAPDEEGRRSWRQGTARGLAELPYHQTRAQMWDELYQTLTDFSFIENKCARVGRLQTADDTGRPTALFTGAFLLQEDYAAALAAYPKE